MSNPYVGEIRIFAGNFAPLDWALCDGRLMAISENTALFQLIGTTYGGDGETTFALPDLRGRLPVHQGNNQGNSYVIGQIAGVETVTLTVAQIPAHTHQIQCSNKGGDQRSPVGAIPAGDAAGVTKLYSDQPPNAAMQWPQTTPTGGSQPHDNTQPFLCVDFIISLFGVFPTQS